jgi:hypothetical protein
MSFPRWAFLSLALFLCSTIALVAVLRAPPGVDFLPGDCPYYAATTISLVEDRDFELRNQLEHDGKTLRDHESFFAVAPGGALLPKHSTLMPILSIPFYLVAGKWGFLGFNVVQMVLLLLGISVLGGDTPITRSVALLGLILSPWLSYVFNYSPDIFGTNLVVWAYVAARRHRLVCCGLLCGLCVWAKVYLVVMLLPLGWLLVLHPWKQWWKLIIPALFALLPMLYLHSKLYGSPLATGYDFEAHFDEAGELYPLGHAARFHQPFFTGLLNLLFDGQLGLVTKSPIWLGWLLLAAVWKSLSKEERLWSILMSIGLWLNLLLFAKYDEWNASIHGNRFLFPSLALSLAAQAPCWFRLWSRYLQSRQHHTSSSHEAIRPAPADSASQPRLG